MSLCKIETYIVPADINPGFRLSDFKAGTFASIISRKSIKKAIVGKLININGKIGSTGDFVVAGDVIEIFKDDSATVHKPLIDIKIEVMYEDDYLAVVNKPAGIVVSGNKKWTLENALPNNLDKSPMEGAIRPEAIHRLDYPTSGAILIGKTVDAVRILNESFKKREIEKRYHAVAIGKMINDGEINVPIDNKTSKSTYTVLQSVESEKYELLNLVELTPHTGRRHQLRKHLASQGNPILGDLEYGVEGKILKGKGLYLHASSLVFEHPFINTTVNVNIPLPSKFGKLFPR